VIDFLRYLFARKFKVNVQYGKGTDNKVIRHWTSPYVGQKAVEVVLFKKPVVAGFRHLYWEELVALSCMPIKGPLEIFSKLRVLPRVSGAIHPVLTFREDGTTGPTTIALGDSFMPSKFLRYAMVRK